MFKRIVIISALGALVFASLAAGQTSQPGCVTVAFEDKTAGPSPLRLSGSVQLCESEKDGSVSYSQEGKLLGRNETQKGITSLVVVIEVRYPHGRLAPKRFQYDHLFGAALGPRGSESFTVGSGSNFELGRLGVPADPYASARTLFVEFADATTFGDLGSAAAMLADRRSGLLAVQSLLNAGNISGEDAFAQALEAHAEDLAVENALKLLREVRRTSGTRAALKRAQDIVGTAAGRPAPRPEGRAN